MYAPDQESAKEEIILFREEFGEKYAKAVACLEEDQEELLTYKDIFTNFDTCVQKGYDEQLFLWSDMSHYRKPSALCQGFANQVDRMEREAAALLEAERGTDVPPVPERGAGRAERARERGRTAPRALG